MDRERIPRLVHLPRVGREAPRPCGCRHAVSAGAVLPPGLWIVPSPTAALSLGAHRQPHRSARPRLVSHGSEQRLPPRHSFQSAAPAAQAPSWAGAAHLLTADPSTPPSGAVITDAIPRRSGAPATGRTVGHRATGTQTRAPRHLHTCTPAHPDPWPPNTWAPRHLGSAMREGREELYPRARHAAQEHRRRPRATCATTRSVRVVDRARGTLSRSPGQRAHDGSRCPVIARRQSRLRASPRPWSGQSQHRSACRT